MILTASGIYNIFTGEITEATPDYFFKNYIPHKIGESDECIFVDMLLEDWVGKENKERMYDIMAYCLLRDYPIQRLFCLIGIGSNGKSSFIRLLIKLLGIENVSSFSLKRITMDKFQTAKLYNKLVAVATEIDYGMFQNTSLLKALVGGDPIPIEFKNKMPFDFFNFAKIFISTNSLPATVDRTDGFYRRWHIEHFPNTFEDGKEITDKVTEEEIERLLKKLLNRLPVLMENGKFINELSLEEKKKMYEIKSNPVELFISSYCIKDIDGFVPMFEFREKFNAFCIENGYRKLSDKEIWGLLGLIGYERGRRRYTFSDGQIHQVRCILGISWSDEKECDICDIKDAALDLGSFKKAQVQIPVSGVTTVTEEDRDVRLKEFLDWMGNTTTWFQAVVDKIEEIWQVSYEKAKIILDDMLKKGILFEPKPAQFKVL